MSGEIEEAAAAPAGDAAPTVVEAQQSHSLRHFNSGGSFRHVCGPCEKHAKNPPGEQTWVEDGPVDIVTGYKPKKRDPNGFDHACADCTANAEVIKEG